MLSSKRLSSASADSRQPRACPGRHSAFAPSSVSLFSRPVRPISPTLLHVVGVVDGPWCRLPCLHTSVKLQTAVTSRLSIACVERPSASWARAVACALQWPRASLCPMGELYRVTIANTLRALADGEGGPVSTSVDRRAHRAKLRGRRDVLCASREQRHVARRDIDGHHQAGGGVWLDHNPHVGKHASTTAKRCSRSSLKRCVGLFPRPPAVSDRCNSTSARTHNSQRTNRNAQSATHNPSLHAN
jgi:hypothetical protein